MSIVNGAVMLERAISIGSDLAKLSKEQSAKLDRLIAIQLQPHAYPSAADGIPFRLDGSNNHIIVYTVTNPQSQQWISVKSVAHDPTNQGAVYVKSGRSILVTAGLPNPGQWEWVGQTGELAPALNRQTSTAPIAIYSTVDCDGVLFLAPTKEAIPSG